MSTTAQEIYEAAIDLMDRRDQVTQEADTQENGDYKARTLGILNTLRQECYMASIHHDPSQRGRGGCPQITDFDTPIKGIDDGVAQEAMPYGLAYHLLLQEDPTTADYLRQKYEETLLVLKREQPGYFEPIWGPYGRQIEYGRFGRW